MKAEPRIIIGRRDHDVVAFTDYANDMQEQSDRVLAMHQHYQREIRDLKATLWSLVIAAGGKIEVHDLDRLRTEDEAAWTVEKSEYRMSTVFSAKRKTT